MLGIFYFVGMSPYMLLYKHIGIDTIQIYSNMGLSNFTASFTTLCLTSCR